MSPQEMAAEVVRELGVSTKDAAQAAHEAAQVIRRDPETMMLLVATQLLRSGEKPPLWKRLWRRVRSWALQ